MMTHKDYLETMAALEEQRVKAMASKEAAKAFLVKAGIWHLLIPREGVIYPDDEDDITSYK
jgi:hypothetical protein